MKRRFLFTLIACALLLPVAFTQNSGNLTPTPASLAVDGSSTSSKSPGSLTTIFASNGGGAGCMFDIVPSAIINEITGLDVNIASSGEKVEIHVYYKEGTCVGYETNPAPWTLLAVSTGISAGLDNPTYIDIAGNGVSFLAGKKYGMYVHLESYPTTGHMARTNGGPNTYSNAELSLTTHCSNLYPAFSSKFLYRIWNGTLYYDFGTPTALTVFPTEISAWYGGFATFKLNGGAALAGRSYGLFGTVTGTSPGTKLPGGLTLPINWDIFTDQVLFLALTGNPLVDGFIGTLDVDGCAEATLTLPSKIPLYFDVPSNFAWCTYNAFDSVSNAVAVKILGAPLPPPNYVYDDGTSENALGWTAGGESVWCHWFDSGVGDMITSVSSTFGSSTAASGPPNGSQCWVYVWEDPNDDGDPVDGILAGNGTGVIANTNTNTFNDYVLDIPASVVGGFFVACHCWQAVGIYAAPMDENSNGNSWFMGGAVFDPTDLTTTAMYEMGSIGFPCVWMLRADND